MVIPEGLRRYANLAGIDHMDNEHVAARLLANQRKVDCCAMCRVDASIHVITDWPLWCAGSGADEFAR